MKTLLYIHGMGGGEDSRIPRLLKEKLSIEEVDVIVHTYPFDPLLAREFIRSMFDECHPDLVIGESLGACHSMELVGVPHLLVSPAFNAPCVLHRYAGLARIPLFRKLAERFFKPRNENRQSLPFDPCILEHFSNVDPYRDISAPIHAFFGSKDKYRFWNIVSVSDWKRFFGASSYTIYAGTHYMEEAFVDSLLIPAILRYL